MHTMHPTLLIGPADWNAARMPRADYEARIDALFSADEKAGGAIVYGNSLDHAALAYLTGFTPKLEAALALIPRRGVPLLLVGGGVNMIAAARPLTWVEQLSPLRNAGQTVAEWARDRTAGAGLLMIGGDAMPFGMRRAIDQALGDRLAEDGTGLLQAQMLHKAPRELATLREACAGLETAVTALRMAQDIGAGTTDCVLAAELAALRWGAQDVRSLFSLDGGRTLQPFDVPVGAAAEPLQVYLAVRHAGYWAEGFVRLARAASPLHAKAKDILRMMIAAAQPGVTGRALAQIAERERGALQAHPIADPVFGNAVGLALQEPPLLSGVDDTRLAAGAVYSLRVGVRDAEAGAIASAMLHVTDRGGEILWSAGERA
jgi:Xaa-Pro aminopeptidase